MFRKLPTKFTFLLEKEMKLKIESFLYLKKQLTDQKKNKTNTKYHCK